MAETKSLLNESIAASMTQDASKSGMEKSDIKSDGDESDAAVAAVGARVEKREDSEQSDQQSDQKTWQEMEKNIIQLVENPGEREVILFMCKVWTLSVSNIDSSNQTYRVRMEVELRQELTASEKEQFARVGARDFEPEHLLSLYSLQTVEVLEREPMIFDHQKPYLLAWEKNKIWIGQNIFLTVELSEELELENFPFDTQHFGIFLQLEHRNIEHPWAEVEYKFDAENSSFALTPGSLNVLGFNFDHPRLELEAYEDNLYFHYIKCVFVLSRDWQFYTTRVIVVLAIVSFLTNFVFLFGEDTLSDKFGYVSTLLLTTVAYLFITTSYLPPLNYMTLLDQYIFFSLGFILFSGIEVAVQERMEFAEDVEDYVWFWGTLGLWLVCHVIFILLCVRAKITEDKKRSMFKFDIDQKQGGDIFYKVESYTEDFVVKENRKIWHKTQFLE